MTIPTKSQQLHLSYDIDAPFPPAFNERMDRIVALGKRRDAILQSEIFDLAAAKALVQDYQDAGFESCAADLQRRVEYYEQRLKAENENRNSENPL
jgi:hypothetical protein